MNVSGGTLIRTAERTKQSAARRCPHCVWVYLCPSSSTDHSRWMCESCGHCWRVKHGDLHPLGFR
jgi:rubredoxin